MKTWLLFCSFSSSTSTSLYSQSRLAEGLVWKHSCRPFCGAAGGSRAHCSSSPGLCLNRKQRWEPCDQVGDGPAQPGPSSPEAETGCCQPRVLPHSQPLWSAICILSLALRASTSSSVSSRPGRGRANHPSVQPKSVCHDLHLFTLMAHPWSTLAWASLTVVF